MAGLQKADAPQIQQALYQRLQAIDPALDPWQPETVKVSRRGNLIFHQQLLLGWDVLQTLQARTLEAILALIGQLTDDAGQSLIQWLQRPRKHGGALMPWTAEAFPAPDASIAPEVLARIRAEFASAHRAAWDAITTFAANWGGILEDSALCPAPPPVHAATWTRQLYATCPGCSLTQSYSLDGQATVPVQWTQPTSIIQSLSAAWRAVAEAVRNTPAWQALRATLVDTASLAATPNVLWQPQTLKAFDTAQSLHRQSFHYDPKPIQYIDGQWTLVIPPDALNLSELQAQLTRAQETIASDPRMSVTAAEAILRQHWEADGRPLWDTALAAWQAASPMLQQVPSLRRSYAALQHLANAWQQPSLQSTPQGVRLGPNTPVLSDGAELVSRFRDLAQALTTEISQMQDALPPTPVIEAIAQVLRDYPAAMGVTTLAALLTGSRAQKLRDRHYDRHPAYDAFRQIYSRTQFIAWTQALIQCHMLSVISVGRHQLPVLKLSSAFDRENTATRPAASLAPEPSDPMPFLSTLIVRKRWRTIAEQAPTNWAAEVALRAAALLWPTGQAAQWHDATRSDAEPSRHPSSGASPDDG